MEASDKYISSENTSPEDDKGRLTGDGGPTAPGIITSDRIPDGDPQTGRAKEFSLVEGSAGLTDQAQLKKITIEGGLTQIPYDFEQKDGSWKFILSDNPFEVLYIDYRQKQTVAPPMVEKNYSVLGSFWQEKLILMNGASREKIKNRYGEDTVNNAEKRLLDAYHKLHTAEGIYNYTSELENKRISKGIHALKGFIELTLADGELTPNEASILIARGIEQDLSEAEVRQHLLKILEEQQFERRTKPPQEDAFRNVWRQQWVKDPVQNSVSWLGKQVSSLEELGQVSFSNKEEAYDRFKNAVYLPSAVMTITRDDSRVKVFEQLIEQNASEEIRYLKIIYRLNPQLPFRFRGAMYHTIKDLLYNAQQDADGFWKADELFRNGYLQIWVEETDAITALTLKDLERNTPGFLSFIYRVNDQYPFYLDQLRIDKPADLAALLLQHPEQWNLTTRYISNRYISTWLTGIGRNDLNEAYNQLLEPVLRATWHTDKDKNMAAVQTLIQTLNEKISLPEIMFDQHVIQLLAVEGTGNASQNFSLSLQTSGYAAVALRLKNEPPGISLSAQKFTLFSLQNETRAAVTLNIDVYKLKKDRLYQFSVIARTVYQEIELPVQVKVVFPTINFIQKLVMYGIGSGIFWGLTQLIIRKLLGNPFAHAGPGTFVYALFSLGFLFVYYRIIVACFKKEFRPIPAIVISSGLVKIILLLEYIGSPVIRESAGIWFFYWLFPGALLGSYIACKKYNLNKWVPLIPFVIIILLAVVLKGKMFFDYLGN